MDENDRCAGRDRRISSQRIDVDFPQDSTRARISRAYRSARASRMRKWPGSSPGASSSPALRSMRLFRDYPNGSLALHFGYIGRNNDRDLKAHRGAGTGGHYRGTDHIGKDRTRAELRSRASWHHRILREVEVDAGGRAGRPVVPHGAGGGGNLVLTVDPICRRWPRRRSATGEARWWRSNRAGAVLALVSALGFRPEPVRRWHLDPGLALTRPTIRCSTAH